MLANGKFSTFLLQTGKSQNKIKNASCNLIRLHKKKIFGIWEIFIFSIPIEYFTLKSGQKMDLAPVIAMNFTCYKLFL